MKRLMPFLVFLMLSMACKTNWEADDKRAFYQACTDEAIKWAGTEDRAKTYCDCVFGKMVQKYPNEADALEHIDSLGKDPDLIKCRDEMKP